MISEINHARKQLQEIIENAGSQLAELDLLEKDQQARRRSLQQVANAVGAQLKKHIDAEKFVSFFERPYAIIPSGKNRVLVVVPKFVNNFSVGWLWKETDQHFIYELNQYSAMLSDVPADLLSEIDFKTDLKAVVDGNLVRFDVGSAEVVKRRLGSHITDIEADRARIVRGHEFSIVADMVKAGCLPFAPRPVEKEDLRDPGSDITLRGYQLPVWEEFLKRGAVGVFHPTGAGKSFISLYAIDRLRGEKIIFSPRKTILEQWEYYLDTHLPHVKSEVRLSTYAGFRPRGESPVLAIFDEAQFLPADTFAKIGLLNAKYRLGLSASPHREDNREHFIIALTGYPMGLNWQEYMKVAKKSYYPIVVHIVKSVASKMQKVRELVNPKKRTIIFCDGITLGGRIAGSFDYEVPHIYGETNDRLSLIHNHKVSVVSRVGDMGMSIKDLEHIVEVEGLFGSRQQQLQRTGRLMHSESKNLRHDIIMLQQEFHDYGKRLWALQEKGFTIEVKQ